MQFLTSYNEIKTFIINHIILTTTWSILLIIIIFITIQEILYNHLIVSNNKTIELINKKNIILIDMRNESEYNSGHIINSVNIPINTSESQNIYKYLKIKNKPCIIICSNGKKSLNTVKYLNKIYFQKTYALKYGINGWTQDNFPLVKT